MCQPGISCDIFTANAAFSRYPSSKIVFRPKATMPHNTSDDELVIRISAHRSARTHRISSATVTLPEGMTRGDIVIGLTPDDAATRIGLRASHSPQAHVHALKLACSAARGEDAPALDTQIATERTLAAEAINTHLRRLLVDWPACLGLEPREYLFAEYHRRLVCGQDHESCFALGGDVLDMVARELLAGFFSQIRMPHGLQEFIERAEAGGSLGSVLAALIGIGASEPPTGGAVPLLGAQSAAAWAATVGWPSADFIKAPTYAGEPAETGPLARHAASPLVKLLLDRGHRISARVFAKAIDVGDCASRMRYPFTDDVPPLADAAPVDSNVGLARVETARGALLCWVRLAEDRIADCAIIPAGAWNFHPAGAFTREATDWESTDQEAALKRLTMLTLALDPSLPFQIVFDEGARKARKHA
jgi:uptake hydrogenase large subunit